MMKNILILFTICLLSGCAVVSGPGTVKPATQMAAPQGPFDRIGLGMKRTEATALLEREATVGYEKDPVSGEFSPVRSRALFSTEIIQVNGVSYQVDSYIIADLKTAAPEEGELMPLIYQNGILVGKGRVELEALRARE
jgi:hypothetical protein